MAKKSGRSARRAGEVDGRDRVWTRVAWLGLAAAWVFLVASLVSFSAADPPSNAVYPPNDPVRNWCGPAGAWVAYHTLRFIGWAVWVPLGATGAGLALPLFGRRVSWFGFRVGGIAVVTGALAGLLALALPKTGPVAGMSGGAVGLWLSVWFSQRFGTLGTVLWLVPLGLVGLILAFDRLVFAVPAWAWRRFVPAARTAGGAAGSAATATARASGGLLGGLRSMLRGRKPVRVRLDDLGTEGVVGDEEGGEEAEGGREERPKRRRGKPAPVEVEDEAEDEEDEEDVEDELPGPAQVYSEDALREKIAKLPVRFAGSQRKMATDDDLRDLQSMGELKGYRFPGLDLLESPEENFSERLENLVRGQARALEHALRQYRIDGEVAGIESGPVITQYDVRLAPGTKVAALQAVSSDVARALKAVNIRIVPNQAGRDTVGVEVPNPTKEKVRLKELMSNTMAFAGMKLPMFLGKDASGEPLIADLTQMPHMLIAGTTGSGKSVCINTIIMGFLYTKKPNELKLVLVDPKMVELSQFKEIPHLMCPVITEMSKAAAILEWACRKMDERYELLAEAGVRDIAGYNDLPWEELRDRFNPQSPEEEARIPRRLPYMVFVIDELADLMMTNKEVEGSIIRIAQKARAVGIHLILATQRPQANVVTGLIKSNMPCRITFKVASGMDSRIVLDQKGGELLLGQGDMLFLSPRSHKLARAQGTLVDDPEIRRVVRFMRDVARPTFERQLLQIRSGGGPESDEERILQSQNNSSASLKAAQEDPMFDRAVEIVLETQRGSVSLLQRRLAIGYTRASRLIDLMGIAGIIGEHKGSVAREVMITPEDWDRMKRLADEEARATGQTPVFSGERTLFPAASDAEGEVEEEQMGTGGTPVPPEGAENEEDEDDEDWEDEEGDDEEDGDWDDEDDDGADDEEDEDDEEEWEEADEVEGEEDDEEDTGGTPVPPEGVEDEEEEDGGGESDRPSGRAAGSLFPTA
ncbi:MAG TPA: DNA translocase FtsK [Phycisphaerales bacterium]|nr:DNA translocase FtsK [Phycisphaerales bacterium]